MSRPVKQQEHQNHGKKIFLNRLTEVKETETVNQKAKAPSVPAMLLFNKAVTSVQVSNHLTHMFPLQKCANLSGSSEEIMEPRWIYSFRLTCPSHIML